MSPNPNILPTVGITDNPNGYTLEHEHAAIRRGLQRLRAQTFAAMDTATVYQSGTETAFWELLRVIDAECVAAGLPSRFSADGTVWE